MVDTCGSCRELHAANCRAVGYRHGACLRFSYYSLLGSFGPLIDGAFGKL
jgi:hypothetical protein